MTEPTSAVDVARRLADACETASIPYAIGGALALAYYAPPRATVDVDINVFLAPQRGLERLLHVLHSAGFVADSPETIARSALDDGQFRGRISGIRVDVFVPAFDFYAELEKRTRSVPLLGRPISILGPEDLLTLKMMFFRRKDLADVEAVLRASSAMLHLDVVRSALVAMVGAEDERVQEWDLIVREITG